MLLATTPMYGNAVRSLPPKPQASITHARGGERAAVTIAKFADEIRTLIRSFWLRIPIEVGSLNINLQRFQTGDKANHRACDRSNRCLRFFPREVDP